MWIRKADIRKAFEERYRAMFEIKERGYTVILEYILVTFDPIIMTHDSSYNKCSYITPTLSCLIPLHSDENPQRTFYFLRHDEPAVVSHNAQHRTKDYASLI